MLAAAAAFAPTAVAASPPPPPMLLPGDASAATADADPATWLLGAPAGTEVPGAREIVPGSYIVPRQRARAVARALGGRLTYAEPNVYRAFHQRAVPDDPLTPVSRWRDAVIDPSLTPPPVARNGPLLGVIDAKAQVTHPEFSGGNVTTLQGRAVAISHGTQTIGVAVAPQNGVGIVGAYPGARAVNVSLPANRIACSDSAKGIRRAVKAGADVLNMSYGSLQFCQSEYQALQFATYKGVTLVAASGNERLDGNPFEFPGSLPHVLTVGALQPNDRAAPFSNTSGALDLVAPGVGIIAPLPAGLDNRDGTQDGYEVVSGTSFAAPIVAAAAVWLRTARKQLSVDQVAQVLRLSSTDIFRKGYDTETGYGKLDMHSALAKKAPPRDPLEPNDDIPFVTGRAFGPPAKAIFTGKGNQKLTALLDRFEDPADVYRIKVPGNSSARVQVNPDFGNPDLEVYAAGTRSLGSDGGLLAASRRPGGKTDQVRLRNGAGGARTALVTVYAARGRVLDSRYTLSVK